MTNERAEGFRTLPGLARAFRAWAVGTGVRSPPAVCGASEPERHLLGALGGIAAVVAGDHVAGWPDSLRRWTTGVGTPPEGLVNGVRNALECRQDPFCVLYNASISAANRRRLGTVFTPPNLVGHMISLAAKEFADGAPARVIDPGAGVGAFTIAAAHEWPMSDISAVDLNPATLGLLATRVAFEIDSDPETADALRRISFVLDDYMSAMPDLLGGESSKSTLILGNPPYTRIQELGSDERHRAAAMSSGIVDDGHANLAVHFQGATLKRMSPQDVSCMVLPGSFSYTRASRGLRRSLWNSSRQISLQTFSPDERVFTGRQVQAAVLLVGAEQAVRPPLEVASLAVLEGSIEVTDHDAVPRAKEEPANWSWSNASRLGPESIALSEVATVRRGVATGANEVFFLTDVAAHRLPPDVCVAAALTLRGFDEARLDEGRHKLLGGDGGRRWLLSVPPDYPLRGELESYLREHEDLVSTRYLPSRRFPWYSIVNLPRPQLLISPLTSSIFKVVVNSVAAVPSNNLMGVTLQDGGNPERLATWLRSDAGQYEMRRMGRPYQGGSLKLEPRDLGSIRVPGRFRLSQQS